jgi:hypothetical protein
LIGIIGNRFGTESELDQEKSISMEEIQTALENNKQIFLFVDQETWHENGFYEQNKNNGTIVYKANVKIHKFISEIKQKDRNNVLQPFASATEIINFLQEQFSGLVLRGLRDKTTDVLKSEINVPPSNAEKTKEGIQLTVKHQDHEYDFSFNYPQNWKIFLFPLTYVSVAGPPNNGFAPNIGIVILPPNKNVLQQTLLDVQKQLEILNRNVKIINFGTTKIGNKRCLRYHVQCTAGENSHLEMIQLFFMHKNRTFCVTATDIQANFKKNAATFNNILGSLQFGKMKGKLRKAIDESSEIKERFHYPKKYYHSDHCYEFTLIKLNNQYFLSDQGKTYEMLDKIFELKEPVVKKNLNAIAKECEVVITEDERLVLPLDFWNDTSSDEQKHLLEEAKCKLFTCVAFMDTMRIFYV